MTLCLVFLNAPHAVNAGVVTQEPVIAQGAWNTGSGIDVRIAAETAPVWLQLLDTTGVKVTEATQICHPLRGGQFGWVGQIRRLVDGKWVKLATVNDWVPNKEGAYMSCAQAPAAGTYALFGYYIAPDKPAEASPTQYVCDSGMWLDARSSLDTNIIIRGQISGVPTGTTITMEITGSVPAGLSGTFTNTTDEDGYFQANTPLTLSEDPTTITVKFTESVHNCSTTATNKLSSKPD